MTEPKDQATLAVVLQGSLVRGPLGFLWIASTSGQDTVGTGRRPLMAAAVKP